MSLAAFPGYAAATAGLASINAAEGKLAPAIERLDEVVQRLPLPEYLTQLAEVELAAGRRAEARAHLDVVRAEEQLLRASGLNTDVESAVFEADHGDPSRAVAIARRGYAAAPSIRAADALGWALTRSGLARQGLTRAREALRLGSRDPLFLYHAGVAALEAGEPAAGRAYLSQALAANPNFSPLHAQQARRLLQG
jgi:tetratricopeptide (TPR) repeat protein